MSRALTVSSATCRRISDANIYVVAREGTPLGDLPEAGEIAESDFYPQLERGLAMGGLLSAIAGASFPNSRLAQFEEVIEAGRLLIMVDATDDRVSLVERIVKTRHPEAEIEGFEPKAPILPK